VARGLVFEELPLLDRPARFTITRGARGNVKADSVEEIQDALDKPFTDDEVRREERRPERGGRGGPDKSKWGRGGGRGGDSRGGSRGGSGGRDDRGGSARGGGRDKGGFRPGSPAGKGKRRGK